MILERLYLENYKQFREPLELFPPEGAIGVVGANGSGKTTLFEAILWAFFGSRGGGPRFANDSIPFSGGSTTDRTLVEVTLSVGGAAYRVSRSLQRNKTEARIYGASGEEVVGGSAEVAEWVQETLLGMDRVAFEATFFARQKELEFFAGITGVERQREIARILGIGQVEDAQKLLRADRNELRAEVNALERLLKNVDPEDLERELAGLREERDLRSSEADDLREKLEVAAKELADARSEGERLEALYRRHNELAGDLRAAESSRDRAAERAAELRETLAALDEDERTVGELRPRTAGLAGVVEEIEEIEEARRREERREPALKEFRRLRMEAHRAVMEANDLLEELDGAGEEPLPGWGALFAIDDETDRMREAATLLSGADGALAEAEKAIRQLQEAEERFQELERAERDLAEAREECESGEAEVKRLDAQIESLTGGESSDERLARLRKKEVLLQRQSAQQNGHADADDGEAERLERARRMIEASDELAECPTCRRGFEPDEHAEVIETLLRQEEEIRARAAEARAECRRLDAEAGELAEELAETEELRERVYALREERTGAAARWEKLREVVKDRAARVELLRDELSGIEPRTGATLEAGALRVERLRALRDARPRVLNFVEDYERACADAADREAEVAELSGGPGYDPARHEELRGRRAQLERLLGRVETLEARLAQRPEYEARLEAAVEEEREAAQRAVTLGEEISSLAFDEGAYFENRARVAEAERLRDELREERDGLNEKLGQLGSRIEGLEAEIRHHEQQRALADEQGSRAATLGEMDKLLSEFYKELTARVRPVLEGEASALVRTLTDGRYERMEFDQNYGVRLFDGLSDAYEISRFSGGEADIVSLSARVALSKMISARGSGALGFIVLDEVFGALDSDRRRNVLLALERLKRTFGQIFIISHVADVQESALLDELWIVEEDEDGKSAVRRVEQRPAELLYASEG